MAASTRTLILLALVACALLTKTTEAADADTSTVADVAAEAERPADGQNASPDAMDIDEATENLEMLVMGHWEPLCLS